MSDPIRIANAVPKVLQTVLAETDLSLVELAAVFRIAAETCTQAQVLQEITLSIAKSRGRP